MQQQSGEDGTCNTCTHLPQHRVHTGIQLPASYRFLALYYYYSYHNKTANGRVVQDSDSGCNQNRNPKPSIWSAAICRLFPSTLTDVSNVSVNFHNCPTASTPRQQFHKLQTKAPGSTCYHTNKIFEMEFFSCF